MVEENFLASIAASPGEEGLRLVFADWLEEQGDARAEYLRLEHQCHQLPPSDKRAQALKKRLQDMSQTLDAVWVAQVNRIPWKVHIPIVGNWVSWPAKKPCEFVARQHPAVGLCLRYAG